MNPYKIIGIFILSILLFGVEYENVTLMFALGGLVGSFMFTYILFEIFIEFPLKLFKKIKKNSKQKEVKNV